MVDLREHRDKETQEQTVAVVPALQVVDKMAAQVYHHQFQDLPYIEQVVVERVMGVTEALVVVLEEQRLEVVHHREEQI
jgi:hypothetical protein